MFQLVWEDVAVDEATVIQTALALGVAAGAKDVAKTAVTDSYNVLKALLGRLFRGRPAAELVLVEHEQDPGTWQAPLVKAIQDTGADQDQEILAVARRLLELGDPAGSQAGKYLIDARYSTGTTIGDNAKVTHHHHGPDGPSRG